MTKPKDLWDDLSILNSLYGELCWDNEDPIELYLIMKMIKSL